MPSYDKWGEPLRDPPTYDLCSSSLASKWGFDDGGEFAQLAADEKVSDYHDLLVAIVRKYLLPLVPGFTFEEIGTSHNPIRVTDEDYEKFINTPIVSVTVTREQAIEVARALKK